MDEYQQPNDAGTDYVRQVQEMNKRHAMEAAQIANGVPHAGFPGYTPRGQLMGERFRDNLPDMLPDMLPLPSQPSLTQALKRLQEHRSHIELLCNMAQDLRQSLRGAEPEAAGPGGIGLNRNTGMVGDLTDALDAQAHGLSTLNRELQRIREVILGGNG